MWHYYPVVSLMQTYIHTYCVFLTVCTVVCGCFGNVILLCYAEFSMFVSALVILHCFALMLQQQLHGCRLFFFSLVAKSSPSLVCLSLPSLFLSHVPFPPLPLLSLSPFPFPLSILPSPCHEAASYKLVMGSKGALAPPVVPRAEPQPLVHCG